MVWLVRSVLAAAVAVASVPRCALAQREALTWTTTDSGVALTCEPLTACVTGDMCSFDQCTDIALNEMACLPAAGASFVGALIPLCCDPDDATSDACPVRRGLRR